MSTTREIEKDNAAGKSGEALKCFSCGARLKSEAEGIRSGRTVLCASCYETCLNPLPKVCWAVS
jgi:protein-arginine kinase activator protein McsA